MEQGQGSLTPEMTRAPQQTRGGGGSRPPFRETVCVLLLNLSDSESEQVTISFPEGYIFNSKVYLRVVFFLAT